jgi:ABC-type glycerol-3-phosphate transport system substrate-binding protein
MPFLNVAGVEYDVLHIPQGTGPKGKRSTRITWDAVAIFSGSKRKEEAWSLIEHLTALETQKIVARYQRSIPSLKAAAPYFEEGNPSVTVRKFTEAAGTYAEMQPITVNWDIMARTWGRVMDNLQSPDPTYRSTPQEAVGEFLNDRELGKVFQPFDSAEAKRYGEFYERKRQRQ